MKKIIYTAILTGVTAALVGCGETTYVERHHYHSNTAPGYAVPITDNTEPSSYRATSGSGN